MTDSERIAQLEALVVALACTIGVEDSPHSPTAFQRDIARVVATIPFGETRTYSEVAREAGRPRADRGVGRALTAVVSAGIPIPWWRVVRKDGRLPAPFRAQRRLLLAAERFHGGDGQPARPIDNRIGKNQETT